MKLELERSGVHVKLERPGVHVKLERSGAIWRTRGSTALSRGLERFDLARLRESPIQARDKKGGREQHQIREDNEQATVI